MPHLIYIGGYGRSGSTVLDIALGNEPGIVSLGEVANLFRQLATSDCPACACGNIIYDCPFWSPVLSTLEKSGLGDWQEIAEIQSFVEGVYGLCALLAGQFSAGKAHEAVGRIYALHMNALFSAIEAACGSHTLVDSSKTTWLTLNRAVALEQLCGIQLCFIHLVRDGRAVMWSGARGSNKQLVYERPRTSTLRGIKTSASWTTVNLLTAFVNRRLNNLLVRYEDFVLQPVKVIDAIQAQFKINVSNLRHNLQLDLPLVTGHLIAGNRLAMNRTIHLRMVDDWREQHSNLNELLYWLISWPAELMLRRKNANE